MFVSAFKNHVLDFLICTFFLIVCLWVLVDLKVEINHNGPAEAFIIFFLILVGAAVSAAGIGISLYGTYYDYQEEKTYQSPYFKN